MHRLLNGLAHTGVLLILLLVLEFCAELVRASSLLPHRDYDRADIVMNIGGLLMGLGISETGMFGVDRIGT